MFNDSLTRYEYKDVVSTTFLVEHLILHLESEDWGV